jgi:hypothetical protein
MPRSITGKARTIMDKFRLPWWPRDARFHNAMYIDSANACATIGIGPSPVLHILGSCTSTEILPAIVQGVAIDMIDLFPHWRA